MWKEGTIGIPEESGKYKAVHYWVKVYEEPSEEYGINGGKISKLSRFTAKSLKVRFL